MSQGLGSGTTTTIPSRSGVRITWQPSLEFLFKVLALEYFLSKYSSSQDRGGSLSIQSWAILTSHSAEQASISSNRWESGSIRPRLASAFRRVWPVNPTISFFVPSGSYAKSLMARSDTFLDDDDECSKEVVAEADHLEKMVLEQVIAGRRWIWRSLCRFATAIAG